jgi:CheY-like chemotaxis protein
MSASLKLLLCVEDDEDDCQWIKEAIQDAAPQLLFTHRQNGQQALLYLSELKEQNSLPCLILLDINMPVMDGKKTLIEIRKDPAYNQIPIIVFTTSSNALDQMFCERYGVELVTKPSGMVQYRETVQQLVLTRCA